MPPLPQVPQAAPVRQPPPRPRALEANFIKWSAEIFRDRGWKSRRTEHEALKGQLDTVAAGLFDPKGENSAAALTAGKLSPGREFKDYLAALSDFEKSPQDGKLAAKAKSAAEAYIAHYEQHPKRIREQKDTRRKHDACQKTLADLKLLGQVQTLGAPPWNSEMAMQAATVKAEADFASLPIGEQSLKSLDGKGVNPTFWVNKAGSKPGEADHTFLFKPTTTRQDRTSIPSGGEPAREALTGRAGDILNGMIGIDCKVPETHIVEVGRERIPDGALSPSVVGKDGSGPLVGSLQQFSRTEGELRENGPMRARAVPPERCQELAILDIVTLHVDRHGGNFLLTGDEAKADLVPIDNGLSFPESPDDLARMSTSHNAMLGLPGAHEPFTPEMLKKIAKLDPEALKTALKTEVGVIENVHGSAKGMVKDAALEQSRRSAMFLKRAAPTLSPALVQVAIGQNAKKLFDPALDDRGFAAVADQVIQDVANDKDVLAEYFQNSAEETSRINDIVEANGWDPVALSPQAIMALYKSDAKAPQPAPNAGNAAQGKLPDPTTQEIAAIKAAFPALSTKIRPETAQTWRELVRLGGMDAVNAVLDRVSNPEARGGGAGSPTRALAMLKQHQAATTALNGAAVTDDRLLDDKRDMLKSLADLLPDPQKTAIKTNADALRQKGDRAGLDKSRDRVVAVLSKLMLREIDDLVTLCATKVAPDQRDKALYELESAKKTLNGGGLVAARQEIDGVKRRNKLP
jgi:hypothetical protein